MRWQDLNRSSNVEDRGRAGGGFGMRGGGIPLGRAGGLGGVGIVIVLVASIFFGFDPTILLQGGDPYETAEPRGTGESATPEARDFVSAVLGSTEEVWGQEFRDAGRTYEQPRLVLFGDAVRSACGTAQSAMGPFYCPLDRKVYLDTAFFDELSRRFAAPGDFAQAYVIAHEVGHHVQTLLGISDQVRRRAETNPGQANALSVRQELQANCFAGLWANHADQARQILESGDVEEALNAASAIGDDRLQKQAQGRVVPDSFTHGSSEQRVRWFKRGLETGDMKACDTFGAERL